MWYLTANPLLVDPTVALSLAEFEGPLHHGRCKAFTAAAHVELFSASYHLVDDAVIAFARAEKTENYTIRATTDYGSLGGKGLAMSSTTTAFHRKQWCLASIDTGAGWSGHKTCLQGTVATKAEPESWRDRVNFWEYMAEGRDHGELIPNFRGEMMETDLRYGILFATYLRMPDEIMEGEQSLASWSGDSRPGTWQFLRYGEVYIGLRAAGIAGGDGNNVGSVMPVRRVIRHKYLRLELPLVEGRKQKLTPAFRRWADCGLVMEVADREECGSFAEFRKQCSAGVWEQYHQFGRHARYRGRHGELYISDAPLDGTVKVMAVDGQTTPPTLIEATGLDRKLVELIPGRRVMQRRLLYVPNYAGTPYYPEKGHVLSEK